MTAAKESTASACYRILSILNDGRERTLGDIVTATGISRGMAICALNRLVTDRAIYVSVASSMKIFSAVERPKPADDRPHVTREQLIACLDDWATVDDISDALSLGPTSIYNRICRLQSSGIELECDNKEPSGSIGRPKKMWRIKK